ncbi:MAG: hypothetical protein VR67_05170 [Peptococcaceae bacterium BRH_c8a]|nr:MAG: hypothetical protein VR67_19225 [Peptococcaceae bacterium BRH_c8a]KJS10418.1 MAG: hypothetical protein VR67_19230 [Peptococcaceae bacterium BRH_c8a]KJS13247.1 MAG: hypothetical protein VR67_05170 [Peptococcaceae bacterium BRH_c8a]
MINEIELIAVIIAGRSNCYIKKSSVYNPYVKSTLYDWEFTLQQGDYLFTDAYRGFNPYSGVEYVYYQGAADSATPIWYCDYVGYVADLPEVIPGEVYQFLKESRGAHLGQCQGNLLTDYEYSNGAWHYENRFTGDLQSLLQVENFFYNNQLVARQMSGARCCKLSLLQVAGK